MFNKDKFKDLFKSKNRKLENLVAFLIILVILLIVINSIIKVDVEKEEYDYYDAEFASNSKTYDNQNNDLEEKLEVILSKISGVSDVSVLITYSTTDETIPIYNEKNSTSVTEETDTSGGIRTIEEENSEKSIVTGADSNPVTRKNNISNN